MENFIFCAAAVHSKIYVNFAFPKNFHTKKLDENSIICCVVILTLLKS